MSAINIVFGLWIVFLTIFVISLIYNCATIEWVKTEIKKAQPKLDESHKSIIKDTCEHSWHTLVNEQQDDQRIVIIECVKCGSISKDIIGRCNHEWEETDNVLAASKYEIAIEPIKELLKRMSSSSAKYDKAMKQIMDKWITDDNVDDSNFERKSVRVKTCKKCGDIFVLDFSNSHLSARVMSGSQQTQQMQEADSTS